MSKPNERVAPPLWMFLAPFWGSVQVAVPFSHGIHGTEGASTVCCRLCGSGAEVEISIRKVKAQEMQDQAAAEEAFCLKNQLLMQEDEEAKSIYAQEK